MRTLILIALVGLAAQLVDGGLGMAYGVTTSTLLLMIGANPAVASATVHLAEVGTTLASGVSHWRFGNVDRRVVLRIGLPGALGAFLGATALGSVDASVTKPFMSGVLLLLGLYILWRFTLGSGRARSRRGQPVPGRLLAPLGLFAGFLDAAGGGGWGPVGTPALLADGRMEPRRVVGSVNTAEFMVTVAASLGFLASLGHQGIHWWWVLALLVGGVVAAPIAAALVRWVPSDVLGPVVGGLIVLTNLRTILGALPWDLPAAAVTVAYGAVLAVWILAVTWAVRKHRASTRRVITAEAAADRPHDRAPADAAAQR